MEQLYKITCIAVNGQTKEIITCLRRYDSYPTEEQLKNLCAELESDDENEGFEISVIDVVCYD